MRAGSILVNALLIASPIKFEPHWTSHTAVQALETTLTMMALTFAGASSSHFSAARRLRGRSGRAQQMLLCAGSRWGEEISSGR
jgi:hypothetical protein